VIKNIGLVGAGAMGEPMGESLLRAGFGLRVCAHRNREPVVRLVAQGAIENDNPADVAAGSDVVVIMVPDAPQVEAALFGTPGVALGLRPDGIVIDMSTISPVASRAFHERLAQAGLRMLDAPVSGGPARAKSGTLTIMVGGAAETFARAEPVLRALGTPTHVGPAGMGETFKLVNQVVIATIMLANAEALVFAKKAGADIDLLRKVLATATASNYLLEQWLPKAWFADKHRGGFALDLLRKDLRAALDAAQAAGVPMPVSSFAKIRYDEAAEQGLGKLDYSSVAELAERAAGVSLSDGEARR
jgi:3-hydroxyisobutyrate dehydrogenase-like beta-hydroxyacid dehydrogenase